MTPAQLIAWRAHNNMTQQALATHLKVSVRTIARYETLGPKGRAIPATIPALLAQMANVKVVDEDPEIIPATHPHLYTRFRNTRYLRTREHPGYGKPMTHKVRVSELATYVPPAPEPPGIGTRMQAMVDAEEGRKPEPLPDYWSRLPPQPDAIFEDDDQ